VIAVRKHRLDTWDMTIPFTGIDGFRQYIVGRFHNKAVAGEKVQAVAGLHVLANRRRTSI
jgi:hypothetical protein